MLRRKINKLDYRKCSPARDEFCHEVSDALNSKSVPYTEKDLIDLVNSYSNGDTESMAIIFLKLIKQL